MATHTHHTDFESQHAPTWCPGCGNFAIWKSLHRALESLNIPPHKALVVYGVGCSGNMANTIHAYGFHGLHGRAVPVALGAKLANSGLTVIIAGGDGDGYGEGLNHFIHSIRSNVDVTYIVHNNSVYGLTTGQAAPTAAKGFKGKSTPDGIIEEPINPIALSLTVGAGFVARGFSGDADQLVDIFVQAIKHPGFALVDVFQPCVTFNKINTYAYYNKIISSLQNDKNYSADNFDAALDKAFQTKPLPVGIFYSSTRRRHYSDELSYLKGRPLVARAAAKRDLAGLYKEFI